MNTFDRHLVRFLIVSFCYFELPIRPAHAEFASTFSITAASQAESTLQKLEQCLQRDDVRAGLEQNGVNPAAVRARVDALSDEELAAIAGRIDSPPAGGETIDVLAFVFGLLLITDVLGFAKVYSFTRSVKK